MPGPRQNFLKELLSLLFFLNSFQSGYVHQSTETSTEVISDFHLPMGVRSFPSWLIVATDRANWPLCCNAPLFAPWCHSLLVSLLPDSLLLPTPSVVPLALLNPRVCECLRVDLNPLLHCYSLPRPSHLVSWVYQNTDDSIIFSPDLSWDLDLANFLTFPQATPRHLKVNTSKTKLFFTSLCNYCHHLLCIVIHAKNLGDILGFSFSFTLHIQSIMPILLSQYISNLPYSFHFRVSHHLLPGLLYSLLPSVSTFDLLQHILI